MSRLHRDVEARFRQIASNSFWGDHLDVRFELVHRVRQLRGLRVLDVATAEGLVLSEAHTSCFRVGVDWNADFVARARANIPGARILRCDMHALPFLEGSFDLVIFAHAIEASQDWAGVVREVIRVVRPGGRLWVTTTNRAHPRYWGTQRLRLQDLAVLFGPPTHARIAGYNPLTWLTRGRGARPLSYLPGIDWLLRLLMRLPARLVSPFVLHYFVEYQRPAGGGLPPELRPTGARQKAAGRVS